MSLSKEKREEAIKKLYYYIGDNKDFKIDVASKLLGVNKQSIYRYLNKLEQDNKLEIERDNKENKYVLKDDVYEYSFDLKGLSEDIVWKKFILPLLSHMSHDHITNLNYAFTEILNNAIDHSEGTSVSLIININDYRTEIIILDNGIGIFEKIRQAMGFSDKNNAILELAKGKFTTDPKSHSGEGIFFSSKAISSFYIYSDDISFLAESDDAPFLFPFKQYKQKGTVIILEMKYDFKPKLSEVFEKFTNQPDDFGFNKTIVPVSLLEYGDNYPTFISRSQAKRLLIRLERFEHIIIDFKGVTEIGQGFADEIFRVFVNNHPNCDLRYINTSEKVINMIERVKNTH